MPLTPQANAIVDDFGKQSGVSPEQQQRLRQAIERSPFVVNEVNRAVADGQLQHFRLVTDPHTHVSGQYLARERVIEVNAAALSDPKDIEQKNDRDSLTNTLGHEVQHALNAKHMAQARQTFEQDLEHVATSAQRDHDYTAPIDKLLKEQLRDEASGQVTGWNADVSALRKEFADAKRPPPTLRDIYERNSSDAENFIKVTYEGDKATYTLKPNIQLDRDLSMPLNDRNVEGITKNILTRPDIGLGYRQSSEYRNYYGASLVSQAVNAERANNLPKPGVEQPEMSLDMAKLGLDRKILEQNGLSLGAGRNPMPYLDKSTTPPTRAQFHDTRDSHDFVPKQPSHGAIRLDDASHPDHAMYQQARGHVHALDRQLGRTPDQLSDNLAAAVTVSARADGLKRIDQVALSDDGSRLWAVQSPPGQQGHLFDRHTSVSTQAANQSIEQSSAQWPQAMQQSHETQQQAQAQVQMQQQAQAAQGPAIVR